MEELPALTTSKYDQLAAFVIVRIQFPCLHMDSNQGDKRKISDVLLRLKAWNALAEAQVYRLNHAFICSILDTLCALI